jgi:hypothetical protein
MAKLSVSLVDAYGRTTKRVYGMDSQVDLATYLSVAAAYVDALQAVTDLGTVRVDIIIPSGEAQTAAQAGANVDRGGTFSGFIEDGNGKKASLKLPCPKLSLVNDDGSIPIEGAVATWLAEFEDDGDFTLSDGERVETWIAGSLDR